MICPGGAEEQQITSGGSPQSPQSNRHDMVRRKSLGASDRA